jgi:hypothetical protein
MKQSTNLESKFVSIDEAVYNERAGRTNKDRARITWVSDIHNNNELIAGSPFPSQRDAIRAICKFLGKPISSNSTGIRANIDSGKSYLGRFLITSKSTSVSPLSPSTDIMTEAPSTKTSIQAPSIEVLIQAPSIEASSIENLNVSFSTAEPHTEENNAPSLLDPCRKFVSKLPGKVGNITAVVDEK